MNILLKFCTLQIQFNLNKINHRNWNVWEIYFSLSVVGKNRGLLKSKSQAKTSKHFYIGITFFCFYWIWSNFWINVTTRRRESESSQKVKEAEDKFGSLKILTVFRLALHEVNWKPVYFTNFWGIKSRIYDACEISNCRDKNIFRGYLDTSTNIGFLSFLLQKYFMWRERGDASKKQNECNTMGKL